jgi:hypothetical protein
MYAESTYRTEGRWPNHFVLELANNSRAGLQARLDIRLRFSTYPSCVSYCFNRNHLLVMCCFVNACSEAQVFGFKIWGTIATKTYCGLAVLRGRTSPMVRNLAGAAQDHPRFILQPHECFSNPSQSNALPPTWWSGVLHQHGERLGGGREVPSLPSALSKRKSHSTAATVATPST